MTRTQFLILLYKKMVRPALLLLVAWFGIRFLAELMQSINASVIGDGFFYAVALNLGFLIAIALLYAGLQKAVTIAAAKAKVNISANSKTTKALGRLSDIALGMVILYVWQHNSGAAIAMVITVCYGTLTDKNTKP